MNPLLSLRDQGQSAWMDYIRRSLITSGGLKRLVEQDGLAGVTSNPTIFDKAIAGSADYDDQLRAELARRPGLDTQALFEALALEDIRQAADVLRGVFDRTGGSDGFVSFEIPAFLATDTTRTVAEARRLFAAIARPNVMIKVPATPAGIPAVEELIAAGININITLMFSLEHYEEVAQAYLRGLQRCEDPARIASVASFFVSRVDTVVDKQLDRLGTPEALALRGRIAIANSKVVYQRFREIFYGAPFASLRARGCRVQRPLWASTSTKNPAYRDVVYVEELVGPDTVNTLPPATIDAFRDHGRVRGATVAEGVDLARQELQKLAQLGIDLGAVTSDLQVEGVAAFAKSYDDLLQTLDRKRSQMPGLPGRRQALDLGRLSATVEGRLETWQRDDVCQRIWARDGTVWSPVAVPELTDRLGWLGLPEEMREAASELSAFAREVKDAGIAHVVVLGMGGSSLAPEVFQATFGNAAGYPRLIVLDSTHPAAVTAAEREVDLRRTLFVVSSKSGTTSETNAFFQYFWSRYPEGAGAGSHFVAITDPGTSLERLARERGFRHIFSAPPDVGGRYSALTVFGLVPAALIGVDVGGLLDRARTLAEASAFCVPARDNPSLSLGVALGELALAGRDKVTFLSEPPFASLPTWLEQLIAESTGKNGRGIVPIADEPTLPADRYGQDRVFVAIQHGEAEGGKAEGGKAEGGKAEGGTLLQALSAAGHPVIRIRVPSPLDLGAEFFRWEFAVAAAGAVLGVQPFDQPDVQLAKDLARRAMSSKQASSGQDVPPVVSDPSAWPGALDRWLSSAKASDYLALQAYLAPSADLTAALQELRRALSLRTGLATTLGYGPRFLHSTGQLHKGGANTGVFLQLSDDAAPDVEVPETTFTFGQLIRAQAAGDAMALSQRGRRVLRLGLGRDAGGAIHALLKAVRGSGVGG